MNFTEKALAISEKIEKSYNIIITSHISPDGDAIGSMLGLYYFIKKQYNKKAKMFINGGINNNLKFLDGVEDIYRYDDSMMEEIMGSDLIFVLDLNDLSRLKEASEPIAMSNAYKIMIDHHIDPKEFADLQFVDINATSTGELIWVIIDSLKGKFDKRISNALYTAIMTDTGSFRFDRTSAETHYIVAKLLENGADPVQCYDQIYNQKTVQAMKLLGMSMVNMDIYKDGRISIMSLRKSDFDMADAIEDDTEGFVANTLSVKGVEVGVLITEREKGELRISFRSKGKYSVREAASKFGGGGHKFAAGARTLNQDFDDVKLKIVTELEKLFI